MRQPVLVIMNVPEDTDLDRLGTDVAHALQNTAPRAWDVEQAIVVQRTDAVPAGALTHAPSCPSCAGPLTAYPEPWCKRTDLHGVFAAANCQVPAKARR